MSEPHTNEAAPAAKNDAEKVEESLRDFIGRVFFLLTQIINYYEQYHLSNEVLDRFEKRITDAETLLEVFDIMKEMFEILMSQIANTTNNQDKLAFGESEEEEQNERENLEKVLQKYQSEIRTHIKKSRELEKLVIELNQKVETVQEQLRGKNKHIEVLGGLVLELGEGLR